MEKNGDELIVNNGIINKIRAYTLPLGETRILARIQHAKEEKLFGGFRAVRTIQYEMINALYKAVANSYKKGMSRMGAGFNSLSYTKMSLKNICAD